MMRRKLMGVLLLMTAAACGKQVSAPVQADAPAQTGGLLPAAEMHSLCSDEPAAFLAARLRGAIDANLDWRGATLECEGGPRPDGRGLRAAFAGELTDPAGKTHRLRFIFGIAPEDAAPGGAQARPTNLTVIIEGEATLYTTGGDGRCAAELTAREPLTSGRALERISARGYCLAPAQNAGGDRRLLVSTFEFTGLIHSGETP
jgi:hypothetical protein